MNNNNFEYLTLVCSYLLASKWGQQTYKEKKTITDSVVLNLGSKSNRKWCTITLALHSHRLSKDPDKPYLNFFFELYSMRSGIWNRCGDTLRGWPLSANGPGSTRDGGKCRETDSFKYESDIQLMSGAQRRISWMSESSWGVAKSVRKHWVHPHFNPGQEQHGI